MPQLEHIEAIERRLWGAADTLRANSSYASNEYFLPVMGLVFLRHAYSRYLMVKDSIESSLPTRGGVTRALTKADFSQQSAIYLRSNAQFNYLVSLPDSEDRAKAVIEAMDSIEADYESLRGILPKNEYQELDNEVLGQLLRTLNPDELKKVKGDVFGRIYEYFLTQFADQKAHDGGEFFTPISIVSVIAHILDPDRGTVLDPACGSGGMFVQSARIVEEHGQNPTDQLTFRGLEKNPTTIRLAKMNLAVHGLEGDIQKAITYYEDPHELLGQADYVMANPPFNVDEIDADKIKSDPRLPFGLPGVNKKGKVGNGNYVWISYFYSYLSERGRAGFVMSSQGSSAGGGEAKVRQKLVETGDVDIMLAIRSGFFYTRTVPCELWFLNRDKPKALQDKVLMIDARNVARRVEGSRKIWEFSPEQEQNLLAIVWLYRGQTQKYLKLVISYCLRCLGEAERCISIEGQFASSDFDLETYAKVFPHFDVILDEFKQAGKDFKDLAKFLVGSFDPVTIRTYLIHWAGQNGLSLNLEKHTRAQGAINGVLLDFTISIETLILNLTPFLDVLPPDSAHKDIHLELTKALSALETDVASYQGALKAHAANWSAASNSQQAVNSLEPLAESSRDLVKQTDLLYRLATRLIDTCEKECDARSSDLWISRDITRKRKAADAARQIAVDQLKQVRYFWRQAHWLTIRFPDAELRDVEGLVKLVDHAEIEANDWSLTPGRYVGVAPEKEEDFDFEEVLRNIHVELEGLNSEAVSLAATIKKNFEELGV